MAEEKKVVEVNPIRCSCGALIVDDDGVCQQGHDHNGLADQFAEKFRSLVKEEFKKGNQEAKAFCESCRQCQKRDLTNCPSATKAIA